MNTEATPQTRITAVTTRVASRCLSAACRLTRDINSDMDAFAGQSAKMYMIVLA